MNTENTNDTFLSSHYATTISLLNVYFSEWSHRDQLLWSQAFKFYFATLIVILLPNISNLFQMDLPPISHLAFRIIGMLLSFVFLYISLGYAVRLHAISESYQRILKKLPEGYNQILPDDIKIKNIPIGFYFKFRLGYIICITLFISLFLLSILFIAFDISLSL